MANIGATVEEGTGFDQLLKQVSREMKAKTSKEALQEIISDNVHLERNYGVKFVPLFLKNLVLKQAFNIQGENLKTITISNLGQIRFPDDMAEEIEEASVILYPTEKSRQLRHVYLWRQAQCQLCEDHPGIGYDFSVF